MNRIVKVAVLVAACAAVTACSTARNLWPFGREDAGPAAVASQGERISILALDNTLAPAEGLAGADFFIPEPQAVTAWPLPGGTQGQVMEHVAAAANFTIAFSSGASASNLVLLKSSSKLSAA